MTKAADTWQAGAHTTLGRTCKGPALATYIQHSTDTHSVRHVPLISPKVRRRVRSERGASVGAGLSIARARRCLIETMRALRAYTGARRASPLRAGMHAVHESSSQQLAPITALADANFDYLAELL
jgi:hypothetical protein